MAQDLRRNVWQKTPGEIRRAYVAAPLTQQSQKSRSGDIVPCMNRWSPLAVGRHASWMGNTVSGTSHRLAGAAELLQDPSLQYESSLGSSRFLRATRVRHEHGLLVVKTFLKPDAGMRLRGLLRRLQLERDALENVPNVLAMQEVIETEVAGYLIRPWLAYSLYDRVSTRPFLTDMEKLWITYQLVYALHATHERKVAHGDLKCENVLVTSSLCVYVTDFASLFKPTYLPLDDPTDFSLFFDSSARRVCHIAPERFYESVTEVPSSASVKRTSGTEVENVSDVLTLEPYHEMLGLGRPHGRITEAMDVFSLGCVLAELWRDGSPLFSLSQMYRYRTGDYDIRPKLDEIPHTGARDMIARMLELRPLERPTLEQLLADTHVFPDSFSACLHLYLVDLQRPSSVLHEKRPPLPSLEPDDRMEKLYQDWPTLLGFIGDVEPVGGDDVCLNVSIPGVSIPCHARRHAPAPDSEALLVLNVVLAHIRHAIRPSSVCHALALIVHMSWAWLSDETRLDRVLPYLVALLSHAHPHVRAMALHGVAALFECLTHLTHANEHVLQECVWPWLAPLVRDESVHVRCMAASCLARLARQAFRLWHASPSLDTDLAALRACLGEYLGALAVDTSSSVRRELLAHAPWALLGTERIESDLLPHMLTYLNEDDSQLRMSLFEAVVPMAPLVDVDTYLHPLMIQAFGDEDAHVQACALHAFGMLIEVWRPVVLWELASYVASLLCHPNAWVREASIDALVRAADTVRDADRWLRLYALLRPRLACDVARLSSATLREHVVPPIPPSALEACIASDVPAPRTGPAKPAQEAIDELVYPPAKPPTVDPDWAAQLPPMPAGTAPHLAALWWYVESRRRSAPKTRGRGPDASLDGVPQRTVFFTAHTTDLAPSPFSLRTAERRLQTLAPVQLRPVPSEAPSQAPAAVPLSDSLRSARRSSDTLSTRSFKLPFLGMPSATAQTSTTLVHAQAERARAERLPEPPAPQSPMHTYEGVEPFIHAHLRAVYHQLASIPAVHPPTKPRRLDSSSNQRPQGALIASFGEHQGAITSVCVSHDHLFFVSASMDKTVRVWDTARLEKNVNSRSRLTYATHTAPVTCVLVLSGTHCIMSASMDGAIHVWGLNVSLGASLPRYAKPYILGRHTWTGDHVRCMAQWSGGTDPVVLLGTSRGRMVFWDVRHMREINTLSHPAAHGSIEALALDPQRHWVCVGTSNGYVALWDTRFHVRLQTWRTSNHARIRACALHPTRPHVLTVATSAVVSLDLGTGAVLETFYSREFGEHVPNITLESCADEAPSDTCWDGSYALCVGADGYMSSPAESPRGWIVTGGSDRVVRFWDLGRADTCTAFGSQIHGEFTMTHHRYIHTFQCIEAPPKRSPLHIHQQVKDAMGTLTSHQDTITALAVIEAPYRCVVAGDRSGVLCVWE